MITYYISTGRGNNLYTLRCYRKFWVDLGALGGRIQEEDEYIKTLCVDSDLAIKKAKDYIDTKHSNDEKAKTYETEDGQKRKQLRVNVNNFIFPEKREQTQSATVEETATIPF